MQYEEALKELKKRNWKISWFFLFETKEEAEHIIKDNNYESKEKDSTTDIMNEITIALAGHTRILSEYIDSNQNIRIRKQRKFIRIFADDKEVKVILSDFDTDLIDFST